MFKYFRSGALQQSVRNLTTFKNDSLRRSTLRFSQLETTFYAMMVGSTETFAFYYAVKRNVSSVELGLLTTAPVLLGSIANWIVPHFTKYRFLKPGITICVLLQILGLLGLFASVSLDNPFPIIFGSLSLYWIGGLTANPLWIDWISGWLPLGRLGRYLSRRYGYTAMITVTTYVIAAFILYRVSGFIVFQIVFGFAVICRLISLLLLALQQSPSPKKPVRESSVSIRAIFQSKLIFWMVLLTSAFRFVTNIATSFLVPYMTEELHFHLGTFALITAVPFFGRMLFLARWGEATRQNPPVVGLQIAMVGISFNCLVWSLTPNLWALTTVEILSGIFWGGFEFITVLMMQEYLPGDARGAIGFHVCLSNFAATAGALLGSALLNLNFHYVEVFRISAGLRFSIALIFILIGMRLLEEKRSSFQPFKFLKLLFRVQLNG